jgi:hypothetical protein
MARSLAGAAISFRLAGRRLKISKLMADLQHIRATRGDVEVHYGSPRNHAPPTSVDWELEEFVETIALLRAKDYYQDD